MTSAPPWQATLPPVATEPRGPIDVEAYALAEVYANLIGLGAATAARSVQVSIGSSEAGHACDRRLAYRLAGVAPTNLRDPWRALVGSGAHEALAGLFARLSATSGRFLTEVAVSYRGVPGTADLYDRATFTVVDFKTTLLKRLRQVRLETPPLTYRVQLQLYAAALDAMGERPRRVALLYLPVDGELSDAYAWTAEYDRAIADDAVDRLERLRVVAPADAVAHPDRLCPWCAHYRPNSTDLSVGCPAGMSERTSINDNALAAQPATSGQRVQPD